MDKNIELTDGEITLRPYQDRDIPLLYEAARESISEVYKWIPFCHPDYSIEESRAWIIQRPSEWEKGTSYDFAITDSVSGHYIGGCGVDRIKPDWGGANLGYWIRTSRTGKGAATATALLLAQFAFNELKLNRVELIISVDNSASLRVAEKAGAVKEGILRNGLIVGGIPNDAVMYSLIPRDLKREIPQGRS